MRHNILEYNGKWAVAGDAGDKRHFLCVCLVPQINLKICGEHHQHPQQTYINSWENNDLVPHVISRRVTSTVTSTTSQRIDL
jgi:hypothetical protein